MLVRLVQVTVAVLFLCGQVWPQNEEDDYYEEAQQHFATDFESECQFDEAEDTTGPNQGEQYMNHDALLRSRRRRPLNAPCIDAPVAINISFAIGDTAELTCTVRQLGEHKVLIHSFLIYYLLHLAEVTANFRQLESEKQATMAADLR